MFKFSQQFFKSQGEQEQRRTRFAEMEPDSSH